MEKRPLVSYVGGVILFIGATLISILDALRRLDFLQKSHPGVYAEITSPPSLFVVGLTGVGAILWGGWQIHQRRTDNKASEIIPPSAGQHISNSNFTGNTRIAGGDIHETYLHKPEDRSLGQPQLFMEFPRGVKNVRYDDYEFWILKNLGGRVATNIEIDDLVLGDYRFEFGHINSIAADKSARVVYRAYYKDRYFTDNEGNSPNPAHGLFQALKTSTEEILENEIPVLVKCRDIDQLLCSTQIIVYHKMLEWIKVKTEPCECS